MVMLSTIGQSKVPTSAVVMVNDVFVTSHSRSTLLLLLFVVWLLQGGSRGSHMKTMSIYGIVPLCAGSLLLSRS
jgi:hypothetical protein